ncbi:discoidin domain-containing protein [Nonomuraea sp. NPDC000554]|uniref:discoidin domain-containing protein n=1 Tax=Nonomuraea sp. NPDC000554 TaxID=3154259 RepID=UPI0033341E20
MSSVKSSAATALVALVAVPAAGSAHVERMPATSAGQVLVVQANLQDSVRQADAADTADLDTFARRLAARTPAAPDALVLTEILGPAARHLADSLGRATGHHYRAEVAGGENAFQPDGSVRENAVIINTDTMVAEQPGGYERVQDEDQAFLAARKRDSSVRVPLVASHPGGDPATAVTALAALVDARFPQAAGRVTVLGGDLRSGRCAVQSADQPVDCAPQAFWDDLTRPKAYSDAYFERSGAQSRDHSGYLFARGQVLDAALDTAYDADLPDRAVCKAAFDAGRSRTASAACRSAYYADAPFGWALLAPGLPVQQSVTPGKVALDHCRLSVRTAAVVARVVNNTGEALTRPVTVDAAAPLTATPAAPSLEIPAHQAAGLAVRITAPRDTPAGEHRLTVHIGTESTEIPVTVTDTCVEPPVYASSFHPGFGPERAVDGDIATFWHSEYQPPTPLPQSITLNLGETKRVSKLDYQPRFDGNLNGTVLDYNVYVSTDGETFTRVASGSWAADARLKTATFPAVEARYVRLEGTRANGGSYLSAAEVTSG